MNLSLSPPLPPSFPLSPSSSRLALGCELVYQRAGSELQDASLSIGGYYRAKTWEATARLGVHSWAVGYQQQFKDNLMLMADLEGSLMQVCCRFEEKINLIWAAVYHHVMISTKEEYVQP